VGRLQVVLNDASDQALAKQQTPRPEPIYYCATGVEMPMYEPCKEMKAERDI
jgi:hypothetical protein